MGSYEIDDLFPGGIKKMVKQGLGNGVKKSLVEHVKKQSKWLKVMEEKIWVDNDLASFSDY
jgi:hypothetical protein